LTNAGQLNLFDPISPIPQAIEPSPPSINSYAVRGFEVGDRVQIINAGSPFQHMNGQKGDVVGLKPDMVSVQVEGVAVSLMFRPEALEKWTPVSEYTTANDEAESVVLFRVGDRVECDSAFVGQVGTVQRIGTHCAVTVAWVDYGGGKPLYPCSLENLIQSDKWPMEYLRKAIAQSH
jgi:ribosomal protein L21E